MLQKNKLKITEKKNKGRPTSIGEGDGAPKN